MRQSPTENERGVTLVELVIVMFLLSIVGAIMFAFLASVLNTTTRANKDVESERSIELTLRPLTEDVRGASTIATVYPSPSTACPAGGSYPTGYGNCLSFKIARPTTGQLACPMSIISYGLGADGVVREDRTDYTVVNATCVATQLYIGKALLTNVVNSGQPLFTYFDRFGNKLNPNANGQTTLPFTTAGTVRVTVNVRYASGSPLLSYTSDLSLRNNR
jgi:prepilin-type N-terminal cleavage/methylation domain-containing protein